MTETTRIYYEGATLDFFVKAVQFGDVHDGKLQRYWIQEQIQKPDAWTVYLVPHLAMSHLRHKPITDFFDPSSAIKYARQMALENRAAALINPTA